MSEVYVDALFVTASREAQAFRAGARYGHRWCHLWSEDVEALHRLAARLGLKRAWFQDKPGFPHYDLVAPKRARALALGAVEKSLLEWVRERRYRQQCAQGTLYVQNDTPSQATPIAKPRAAAPA